MTNSAGTLKAHSSNLITGMSPVLLYPFQLGKLRVTFKLYASNKLANDEEKADSQISL